LFDCLAMLKNISQTNGIGINTLISRMDLQTLILSNHTTALQLIQWQLGNLTEMCHQLGISLELGFNLTLNGLWQVNLTLTQLAEMFPQFGQNISRIETKIDQLLAQNCSSEIVFPNWMNQSITDLTALLEQRFEESNHNRTLQFLILHNALDYLRNWLADKFNVTENHFVLINSEFSYLEQLIYNISLAEQEEDEDQELILNITESKINQILQWTENSTVIWQNIISLIQNYFELGNSTCSAVSEQIVNLTNIISSVVTNTQNNQMLINCVAGSRCSGWQWWNGTECVDNTCFGIGYRDRSACSGDGVCVKHDTCHCFDGSWGQMCQHSCRKN